MKQLWYSVLVSKYTPFLYHHMGHYCDGEPSLLDCLVVAIFQISFESGKVTWTTTNRTLRYNLVETSIHVRLRGIKKVRANVVCLWMWLLLTVGMNKERDDENRPNQVLCTIRVLDLHELTLVQVKDLLLSVSLIY